MICVYFLRNYEKIKFYIKLKYSDAIKVIKNYSNKEYLNCKADIDVSILMPKIPGIPKSYTFNVLKKIKIPAIKPSIKIVNFRIKKVPLKINFKENGDLKMVE